MADGKITLYGELESGVPNGKIVDYRFVANTPEIYTKKEIDDKITNAINEAINDALNTPL